MAWPHFQQAGDVAGAGQGMGRGTAGGVDQGMDRNAGLAASKAIVRASPYFLRDCGWVQGKGLGAPGVRGERMVTEAGLLRAAVNGIAEGWIAVMCGLARVLARARGDLTGAGERGRIAANLPRERTGAGRGKAWCGCALNQGLSGRKTHRCGLAALTCFMSIPARTGQDGVEKTGTADFLAW